MYLETLALRMEPDKFGALADALKGFKKPSKAGFDGTGYGGKSCSPTTCAASSQRS